MKEASATPYIHLASQEILHVNLDTRSPGSYLLPTWPGLGVEAGHGTPAARQLYSVMMAMCIWSVYALYIGEVEGGGVVWAARVYVTVGLSDKGKLAKPREKKQDYSSSQ